MYMCEEAIIKQTSQGTLLRLPFGPSKIPFALSGDVIVHASSKQLYYMQAVHKHATGYAHGLLHKCKLLLQCMQTCC